MQKHAELVDRFRINKNQLKMIFVDETVINAARERIKLKAIILKLILRRIDFTNS